MATLQVMSTAGHSSFAGDGYVLQASMHFALQVKKSIKDDVTLTAAIEFIIFCEESNNAKTTVFVNFV